MILFLESNIGNTHRKTISNNMVFVVSTGFLENTKKSNVLLEGFYMIYNLCS